MIDYLKEILICLENIGFIILISGNEDVNLMQYHMDSYTFISFIVELENHFNIAIPDEYLNYQTIESLRGLSNLIELLCNENKYV